MAEYYRNWNLVVHDWLYAYIYKDVAMVRIYILIRRRFLTALAILGER